MANPIIYGPAYSTYARSLRLALEEKGVAYDLHEVDILTGAHQQPEHVARHPFTKVPAFEHDGFALFETGATLGYIDDAFGGVKLTPTDMRERARMTQIINVVDAYGYPSCITNVFIPRVVAPMLGGETDENCIKEALPKVKTFLECLNGMVDDSGYMAGGSLSLADLHVVPVYDYISQTPDAASIISGTPKLSAWWEKMSARESVQKTKPSLG